MEIKKRFVIVLFVLLILISVNVLSCSEDDEWAYVEEYRCEEGVRQIKQVRDPECFNETIKWADYPCQENQLCEGEGVCANNELCGNSIINENEQCDGPDDECCTSSCTYETDKTQTCGVGECEITRNLCYNGEVIDCNPGEPSEELCNGLDDDCDGETDEDFNDTYYPDSDGDGFGNPSVDATSCPEQGYVVNNEDCNDNDPDLSPNSTESCDNIDNNCDNIIDNIPYESMPRCFTMIKHLTPFGVCKNVKTECDSAQKKYFCDLNKIPDYEEVEITCDGLDNDCDGKVDEFCGCNPGDTKKCGSSTGECETGEQVCGEDFEWSNCLGPVNPIDEICDSLDNDCNGEIDEDLTKPCTVGNCTGVQRCFYGNWYKCETDCVQTKEIEITLNKTVISNFVQEAQLTTEEVQDALETVEVVNQSIDYSYTETKTVVKNNIVPEKNLHELEYTLFIPKCLTTYLDDIKFENQNYTIIKEDPVIAWHFVDVEDRIDLGYTVNRKIDPECLEKIKGLPIAKVIGGDLDKEDQYGAPKMIITSLVILLGVSLVVYYQKKPRSQKSVEEYEQEIIGKQRKNLLQQMKNFKSKEKAVKYLNKTKLSDDDKEWIIKRL